VANSERGSEAAGGAGTGPADAARRAFDRFSVRAAAAAGLLLLVSALTFDPKLYINGDNIDYMQLAHRALTEGALWGSSKFPPLFPLMLAPVQALFGSALLPQKLLVLLLYAACGPLLLWLAERRLPRGLALSAVLAAMVAVPVLEFSHYVMSEIPYLLLSLAALVVGERLLSRGGPEPQPRGRARIWPPPRGLLLLSALAAAAFYTRTAGAVLVVGFLGVVLLGGRRRWIPAALALSALIFLPWALHSLSGSATGQTYLDQIGRVNPYFPEERALDLSSLLTRLHQNGARYFFYERPRALVPVVYQSTYTPRYGPRLPVPWFLALPLLALLLAGGVRAARRLPLTATVTLGSIGLCLLWPPIWAGVRFLVPILPLMTLFLVLGVGEAARRLPRAGERAARRAIAVTLGVLLVLGGINLYRYVRETREYPPPWGVYFEAVAWAKGHLPAGSLVIDRKPGIFTFVSGLPAVTFPREADPDRMLQFFRERGARYVHVSTIPYDDLPRFLYPAVMRRPTYFEPVCGWMYPDSTWSLILEFRPGADARGLVLPEGMPPTETP
jgi:hypothetical protein